ncbi:hypothetical protein KKD49_02670 [Myxococcota bacterium]|nr:hypothetical protein [Myxococcota bacterium]
MPYFWSFATGSCRDRSAGNDATSVRRPPIIAQCFPVWGLAFISLSIPPFVAPPPAAQQKGAGVRTRTRS